MQAMSLSEVARELGGSLAGCDAQFEAVGTHSGQLPARALFVALPGTRRDGHDFIGEAHGAGAVGALVSRLVATALPCVQVADTTAALARLGALNRSRFPAPLVAVTGSAGKTSCTRMIAHILGRSGPVSRPERSFNNHIGVPLSLLRLSGEHRAAVVEVGASAPGEVDALAALSRPDVAVITNALPAHLAGFGDMDGIVRSKGELLDQLGDSGCAVLNRDDPAFARWAHRVGGRRVISFGCSEQADFRVFNPCLDAAYGVAFTLRSALGACPVRLQLPGVHSALIAAAAAAAAHAVGSGLEAIRAGLEAMRPLPGRMQLVRAADPLLIDDSHNANPGAVLAMIAVLAHCPGPRLLLLGQMVELGAESADWHRKIGVQARRAGIEALVCCGTEAAPAAEGFGTAGQHFDTVPELLAALPGLVAGSASILVKGSRVTAMETVVEQLAGRGSASCAAGEG